VEKDTSLDKQRTALLKRRGREEWIQAAMRSRRQRLAERGKLQEDIQTSGQVVLKVVPNHILFIVASLTKKKKKKKKKSRENGGVLR